MGKIERLICVIIMLFIAISAIGSIPKDEYALLAFFELLIGCLIGMTIFIKRN